MATDPVLYDIKEICAEAGVTPRTVHFYIQQGLLPPAGSLGPGTKYSEAHLHKLRLIKLLQKEHLPLSEIRRRLESLTDAQVQNLANQRHSRERLSNSSAVEYIRGILTGESSLVPRPSLNDPPGHHSASQTLQEPNGRYERGHTVERSQWERVALAPDIELHFRRPLARVQNRKVEALIRYARETFKEE
jgi:DNA-binding transcriptional MerR regulator